MKNKSKIAILILHLLPGLTFAGDFVCNQIDWTHNGGGITIGPGRNDGANRIYVNGNDVFEYTWQDSVWQIDTIESVSGWLDKDIVAGPGRNDGICRLYICRQGKLLEYTYNGGIWEKAVIDSGNIWTYNMPVALGNIKNDDTVRVLIAVNDSFTVAYTYQSAGNIWQADTVGKTNGQIRGITIGKGRNEDTNRVYAGGGNADLYEYWYADNIWNKKYMAGNFISTAIGIGRNDNIKRLYLHGIFETTWIIDHWSTNFLDTTSGSYVGRSVISNGRNDSKNRLYVAAEQLINPTDSADYYYVYILEKSYDSLTGWTRKEIPAVIGGLPAFMTYVAAGDARNDGKNRIYGHCSSGELFEFAWDDTINGVEHEDVKVVNNINVRKVLQVGPNPFYSYTVISNLPSNVELNIYDITGRLVEKTNSTKVGAKLKAGVYFVTAGGYKPAKMVKIK
jgi:hypothetical protein